jgi:uroporphyrinogen-III synthase
MPVTVFVTRPRREAGEWVAILRERGFDARALPLIDITQPEDPGLPGLCWQHIGNYRAAMFVSANAVDGFFREAIHPWPDGLVAWATGPGTAAALRAAGVPAPQVVSPPADAAQFDSEALWPLVASSVQPGFRVLIVRGDDQTLRGTPAAPHPGTGRDWLARQVMGQGGEVEFVVSYVRRCPVWGESEREAATRAATDGTVWLFSSSEAVRHLQQLLPGQDWASARAIATHERIAEAVQRAGFGQCRSSRPAVPDVVASIESFT